MASGTPKQVIAQLGLQEVIPNQSARDVEAFVDMLISSVQAPASAPATVETAANTNYAATISQ